LTPRRTSVLSLILGWDSAVSRHRKRKVAVKFITCMWRKCSHNRQMKGTTDREKCGFPLA